jgi:hypothetical protein
MERQGKARNRRRGRGRGRGRERERERGKGGDDVIIADGLILGAHPADRTMNDWTNERAQK